MATFGFVLFIAMAGFGNVFYILCVNAVYSVPLTEEHPEYLDADFFIGQNNFLISLIYSFRLGLGDFNTDMYIGSAA